MNINSVIISGNISLEGNFFEAADKSFCVYDNSIAYSERFKQEYRTLFIKFKCFGKSARRLKEQITVGSNVTIQGTLSMDISKDGKFKKTVIIANKVVINTRKVNEKDVLVSESFDFSSIAVDDISTSNSQITENSNEVIDKEVPVNTTSIAKEEEVSNITNTFNNVSSDDVLTLVEDENIPFEDNNSGNDESKKLQDEINELAGNDFMSLLD